MLCIATGNRECGSDGCEDIKTCLCLLDWTCVQDIGRKADIFDKNLLFEAKTIRRSSLCQEY